MFSTVRINEAASELEFAVKPGVKNWSAVDFDGELGEAVRVKRRRRFELETGRIGVRSDDMHWGRLRHRLWHRPGDERTVSHDDVRSRSNDAFAPGFGFAQLLKPEIVKFTRNDCGRVI